MPSKVIGTIRSRLERHNAPAGLDAILSHADPNAVFEDRLRWLASLTRWISRSTVLPSDGSVERTRPGPLARLRYALNVLDRNPEWMGRVARVLRSVIVEVDSLELLCEVGIPREPSFLSEALERLSARILPTNPFRAELGAVLLALFPRARDAAWLEEVDGALLDRFEALLHLGVESEESVWLQTRLDAREALLVLVGDIRAIGLSTPIRRRLGLVPFRDLPFFRLTRLVEEAASAQDAGEAATFEELKVELVGVLGLCDGTAETVFRNLDEHGVSVRVVYLVERMQAQVRRARALVLVARPEGASASSVLRLLAHLVREGHQQRRLRALAARNLHLLARNLVSRAAETGEHYIARNRGEYVAMLRSAFGGGVVAALVTWVKLGITALHGPHLAEGVLVSLNYAIGFVAIQLAHFTLATKQPATTAPALAARLREANDAAGLERFASDVADLVRSQVASIVGNLALTLPVSLGIGLGARWWLGHPILAVEKSSSLVSSLSLLGPSLFYAALTGVYLWLSSVIAAWSDNWFALRRVGEGIGHDPFLRAFVGRQGADRLATWLDDHIAALAGNISLGVLLGLTPAVFAASGLPVEIRHVTIAAGQLAAAVSTLGLAALSTPSFWWATAGVLAIGMVNVGVSFGLALGVAVRAQGTLAVERRAIRSVIVGRLWSEPLSFLWPVRPRTSAAAEAIH